MTRQWTWARGLTAGVVMLAMAAVWTAAADRPARRKRTFPPVPPAPKGMTTKSVIYKKTPQAELKMELHFPPGWKASDKRGAIVFFFGGGWANGSPRQFLAQANYLAGRGMVAARADYRVKSRHEVTPDACVEDAKSAVRYLRAHAKELGIDPNRIVASGGSAGGHLAACTATTPGLEAEGEDTKVSSKPNLLVLFNPALKFEGVEMLMKRLGGRKGVARQISPTLNLTKETPAALLLFGTKDFLLAQGKEWMARAKELGHDSELYLAEGQSHGFFNREPWRTRTIERMDAFLVKHNYLRPGVIADKEE